MTTTTSNINTAVKNLQSSINEMLDTYAKYLSAKAKGQEPTIIIDDKDMDSVLKYIKEMPKLEEFEKLIGGSAITDKEVVVGSPFEQRSKLVKAKINGSTTSSTAKV